MKKIVIGMFALCMMSSPALALEPVEGFMGGSALNTAYQAHELKTIFEGYGITMDDGGAALSVLNKAYKPEVMHQVLTGYGLELSPEQVVAQDLGALNYARVVDGDIVFNNRTSVVYKNNELKRLLAAYQFPMKAMTAKVGDSDHDGVMDDMDKCPNTPMGVMADERGCWSVHAPFLFAFDSAQINPEYMSKLDKAVKIFGENPGITARLDGYTDSTGSAEYNKMLSEKRAMAVKNYLVENGISASRLSTMAYGEENPAYSNETKEGRMKNRRVEYTISQ